MSILEELAASTRLRVEKQKEQISPKRMEEMARALEPKTFAFEKALGASAPALICECKKASPSRGLIASEYDPAAIAAEYEAAGASCISVLSEPERFGGSENDLEAVCRTVSIPVLRKDFIIDPYMIFHSRILGADAVLLIASLLSDEQLRQFLGLCDELGMSALCEAHDGQEIERLLQAKARIIGVNNRSLHTFEVDCSNALSLRSLVPEEVLFVSESGIQNPQQLEPLAAAGVDAVLIGEMLMRSSERCQTLQALRQFQKTEVCR